MTVAIDKRKSTGAAVDTMVDEPELPVQGAARSTRSRPRRLKRSAGALAPALVARLAAQARVQGCKPLGRGGCCSS